MILKGKKLLVTGVVTKQSIAYHVARKAMENGAEIILTGGPGKSCRLTERVAGFLQPEPAVIQMDVTDDDQVTKTAEFIKEKWGRLDGILHSIAYAGPECFGENYTDTAWQPVAQAMEISAHSLARIGSAFAPLMQGGSIVSLDFDADMVWAFYGWMGTCKAALESVSRYMAMDLGRRFGIRVNCIAAGPLKTVAAKGIPAFSDVKSLWDERAPLMWSVEDSASDVADTAIFLFSDLSRMITGEKIHVDGGFHIMGSPIENKSC